MDFQLEPTKQSIVNRVREYVDRELVPLETAFLQSGLGPLLPVLRGKRAEVKKLGLWGPIYPHEHGGLGLDLVDARPDIGGARPLAARALRLRLPGARRRQHRDPAQVRHAGAEGALARAAGARRDPQLLLDDRAGQPRLQPD